MKVTVKLSPEVIEYMKHLQQTYDAPDQSAEDVLNERATASVEYDFLCVAAERRGISIARRSWRKASDVLDAYREHLNRWRAGIGEQRR